MHPVPEIKITDQAGASLENQRNGVKNMYNFDEIIDRRHTNAMNTDGFRDYIFHADETISRPSALPVRDSTISTTNSL